MECPRKKMMEQKLKNSVLILGGNRRDNKNITGATAIHACFQANLVSGSV